MELGPIWRAMLRNKGGFLLIALQIAVTMGIPGLAAFVWLIAAFSPLRKL